jgi:lipoprotein-anchoring transpeptidase ErfK/SrfK
MTRPTPRWIGLSGSWALLVLALGLASIAVAGELINMRNLRRLDRVAVVDRLIAARYGSATEALRQQQTRRASEVGALQGRVADITRQTNDLPDTRQTIIVSTAENKLYVHRSGQMVFEAVCATGKGTTLAVDGKTLVFDTPIGKFRIQSKDENPLWVPPDWHYVEAAHRNGMRVVHLNPGDAIDADTGQPAISGNDGVWSWFTGGSSHRVLRVKNNTVVVEGEDGAERELPPGTMIIAGRTIIVPPVNTPQRHFDKVLGKYRLEIGSGYGIHGTDEPQKLGRAASHGCVRLGDADVAKLYQMANVGDEVIIY